MLPGPSTTAGIPAAAYLLASVPKGGARCLGASERFFARRLRRLDNRRLLRRFKRLHDQERRLQFGAQLWVKAARLFNQRAQRSLRLLRVFARYEPPVDLNDALMRDDVHLRSAADGRRY